MTKSIIGTMDKIIVEVLRKKQTEGGIIVPDTAQNEPQGYGRIVSVGKDATQHTFVKDQIVVFAKFAGQDIILENKIMKVVKADEIYGVLMGYAESEFQTLDMPL